MRMLTLLALMALVAFSAGDALAQENKKGPDTNRPLYCMPGVGGCLDRCYEDYGGEGIFWQTCAAACVNDYCWYAGPDTEKPPGMIKIEGNAFRLVKGTKHALDRQRTKPAPKTHHPIREVTEAPSLRVAR